MHVGTQRTPPEDMWCTVSHLIGTEPLQGVDASVRAPSAECLGTRVAVRMLAPGAGTSAVPRLCVVVVKGVAVWFGAGRGAMCVVACHFTAKYRDSSKVTLRIAFQQQLARVSLRLGRLGRPKGGWGPGWARA